MCMHERGEILNVAMYSRLVKFSTSSNISFIIIMYYVQGDLSVHIYVLW